MKDVNVCVTTTIHIQNMKLYRTIKPLKNMAMVKA